MESIAVGDLVTVTAGGPPVDGIVFDTPSAKKVVVVVVDPGRGPVFRTVHPETLSAREAEGSDDRAMRLLIRRTPHPAHRAARDMTRPGRGAAGHTRAATHRTSDH
jgi:hypothetical protein